MSQSLCLVSTLWVSMPVYCLRYGHAAASSSSIEFVFLLLRRAKSRDNSAPTFPEVVGSISCYVPAHFQARQPKVSLQPLSNQSSSTYPGKRRSLTLQPKLQNGVLPCFPSITDLSHHHDIAAYTVKAPSSQEGICQEAQRQFRILECDVLVVAHLLAMLTSVGHPLPCSRYRLLERQLVASSAAQQTAKGYIFLR